MLLQNWSQPIVSSCFKFCRFDCKGDCKSSIPIEWIWFKKCWKGLIWQSTVANFVWYCPKIMSFFLLTKGQLISKRNSQAEDSPKKRTNEFVFTSMRRVFVRFLGESSARKKSFRDYLTFRTIFSHSVGFFQKTDKNTSHTSKNEFIRSFFGRILGLTICFRKLIDL